MPLDDVFDRPSNESFVLRLGAILPWLVPLLRTHETQRRHHHHHHDCDDDDDDRHAQSLASKMAQCPLSTQPSTTIEGLLKFP